jgi:hypothetical protein
MIFDHGTIELPVEWFFLADIVMENNKICWVVGPNLLLFDSCIFGFESVIV